MAKIIKMDGYKLGILFLLLTLFTHQKVMTNEEVNYNNKRILEEKKAEQKDFRD